ncbi:MAG: hypothetical protein U0136_17690 [Bdellovibrionota bacterium]
MIADVVICARGGGLGHAARGIAAAEVLERDGREPLLLLRPGLDVEKLRMPGWLLKKTRFCSLSELSGVTGQALLVDTFPSGWRENISPTVLKRFDERILLARYAEGASYALVAEWFDAVLFPYSQTYSEWNLPPFSGIPIGFVIRPQPAFNQTPNGKLAFIDTEHRCQEGLLNQITEHARVAGYELSVFFDLSREIYAEKFLFAGAGYNMFYEALERKLDARFIPVEKRYDNQRKRADGFRLNLNGLPDLDRWLAFKSFPTFDIQICRTFTGDDAKRRQRYGS